MVDHFNWEHLADIDCDINKFIPDWHGISLLEEQISTYAPVLKIELDKIGDIIRDVKDNKYEEYENKIRKISGFENIRLLKEKGKKRFVIYAYTALVNHDPKYYDHNNNTYIRLCGFFGKQDDKFQYFFIGSVSGYEFLLTPKFSLGTGGIGDDTFMLENLSLDDNPKKMIVKYLSSQMDKMNKIYKDNKNSY